MPEKNGFSDENPFFSIQDEEEHRIREQGEKGDCRGISKE